MPCAQITWLGRTSPTLVLELVVMIHRLPNRHQPIRRRGVTLGKARHADAESPRVGMGPALIEPVDETHQIDGVLELVLRLVVVGHVARRVTAQCQDVGDTGPCVPLEDLLELMLDVADAGQVRDGLDAGRLSNPDDEVVCLPARGAPRPVRHRDEGGFELLQPLDGLEKRLPAVVRFWREELEREGDAVLFEDVPDVHARMGPQSPRTLETSAGSHSPQI